MSGPRVFTAHPREALRAWQHELRAGKWWDRGACRAVAARLGEIASSAGPIRLRFDGTALTLDGEAVVDCDPKLDAILQRAHAEGLRQITFLPNLDAGDFEQMMDALTTDLTQAEYREDDLVTLLGGLTTGTIRFVFSESSDAQLMQQGELPKLMDALPEVGSASEAEPVLDARLQRFGQEVSSACAQPLTDFATAALAMAQGLSPKEGEALGRLLGALLVACVRDEGIEEVRKHLKSFVAWTESHRDAPAAGAFRSGVLRPELRAAVVASMEKSSAGTRKIALDVLNLLPADQAREAAGGLVRFANQGAKVDAFAVLAQGGAGALEAAGRALPSLNAEAALFLVASVRGAHDSEEAREFFRAVLQYPEPRVRIAAVAWWVQRPTAVSQPALLNALGDDVREVRLAAAYLAMSRDPNVATDLLRRWTETDRFHLLDLDEKRFYVLLLARHRGDEALPWLRTIVETPNVLRRQRTDEWRAVAVAAMGFLMDERDLEEIRKHAKSAFSGNALRQEAAHVVARRQKGLAPYSDPTNELFTYGEQLLAAVEEACRQASAANPLLLGARTSSKSSSSELPGSGDLVATLPPARDGVSADVVATVPPEGAVAAGTREVPSGGDKAVLSPQALHDLLQAFSYDSLPPMPPSKIPGSADE